MEEEKRSEARRLASLRSPLVKTRPTLPTKASSRGAQVSLPVRSLYSLMQRFISVFLPIRTALLGRNP